MTPNSKPKSARDIVQMPAVCMPGFRAQLAAERGLSGKILIKTWGGLGDEICTEPTLRYILKEFDDCEISLAAERPELFRHLNFKRVFDLKNEQPIWDNYFVLQTIVPPEDLVWQFFSHMLTHCVDFPSLCAVRCQLPVASREVILRPLEPKNVADLVSLIPHSAVFVHPGKHWASKTFPKDWWDEVLGCVISRGGTPVLIGADTDDNRGTVDVDTKGSIDLRNKLSINDSIWLLQRAKVLLTNDSSPLHMAVTGDAWIGFIATCKHPDYIMHWRKGQWGYRQKNFGLGGIWDIVNNNPNAVDEVTAEFVEESVLRSWLPDPGNIANWAVDKTVI